MTSFPPKTDHPNTQQTITFFITLNETFNKEKKGKIGDLYGRLVGNKKSKDKELWQHYRRQDILE